MTDIVSMSSLSESELASLAASLENHSDHPLAQSIVKYASEHGYEVAQSTHTEAVPGKGIIATVNGMKVWAGNRALVSH